VFSVAVIKITAKSGVPAGEEGVGKLLLFSINPNQNSVPIVEIWARTEREVPKQRKKIRKNLWRNFMDVSTVNTEGLVYQLPI
jgi:hypothetical protein